MTLNSTQVHNRGLQLRLTRLTWKQLPGLLGTVLSQAHTAIYPFRVRHALSRLVTRAHVKFMFDKTAREDRCSQLFDSLNAMPLLLRIN